MDLQEGVFVKVWWEDPWMSGVVVPVICGGGTLGLGAAIWEYSFLGPDSESLEDVRPP